MISKLDRRGQFDFGAATLVFPATSKCCNCFSSLFAPSDNRFWLPSEEGSGDRMCVSCEQNVESWNIQGLSGSSTKHFILDQWFHRIWAAFALSFLSAENRHFHFGLEFVEFRSKRTAKRLFSPARIVHTISHRMKQNVLLFPSRSLRLVFLVKERLLLSSKKIICMCNFVHSVNSLFLNLVRCLNDGVCDFSHFRSLRTLRNLRLDVSSPALYHRWTEFSHATFMSFWFRLISVRCMISCRFHRITMTLLAASQWMLLCCVFFLVDKQESRALNTGALQAQQDTYTWKCMGKDPRGQVGEPRREGRTSGSGMGPLVGPALALLEGQQSVLPGRENEGCPRISADRASFEAVWVSKTSR